MKQSSVVVKWVGMFVVAALVLGAMVRFQSAQAQNRRDPAVEQFQPPPGPAGEPGFVPPGAPVGRPMMGPTSGVAIAVAGESVYVVQGNSLYKFTADDLRLVKRVILEPGPLPGRPGVEGRPDRPRGEGERRRDGEG
ncbi:MAG: hypothetical protein NZT92_22365 [Abditibacteriales bacterium]|nr:hypothetical protein [Abditibacteriales bacterium]